MAARLLSLATACASGPSVCGATMAACPRRFCVRGFPAHSAEPCLQDLEALAAVGLAKGARYLRLPLDLHAITVPSVGHGFRHHGLHSLRPLSCLFLKPIGTLSELAACPA